MHSRREELESFRWQSPTSCHLLFHPPRNHDNNNNMHTDTCNPPSSCTPRITRCFQTRTQGQEGTSPAQCHTVSAELGLSLGLGDPRAVFSMLAAASHSSPCLHSQMPITTAWRAAYKALYLDPSSNFPNSGSQDRWSPESAFCHYPGRF